MTTFRNLSGPFVDAKERSIPQNQVSNTNRFVDGHNFCRQRADETQNGFVDETGFCSL
jgi:hypothetical protein